MFSTSPKIKLILESSFHAAKSTLKKLFKVTYFLFIFFLLGTTLLPYNKIDIVDFKYSSALYWNWLFSQNANKNAKKYNAIYKGKLQFYLQTYFEL